MKSRTPVVLSLAVSGCALWRKDREEPVDSGPREQNAEPVLQPSEALKPKSLELASPVSDHFYLRGTYFQGGVTTQLRLDSSAAAADGTLLSAPDGREDAIVLKLLLRQSANNY